MANTKITSKVIADANILTAAIADNAVTGDKVADNVALAGNPTTTTQTAGNSTTRIATTAFVSTAISNLVDSSPAALNTLNELAAALGDDANFSTTVTNSIATKVALSGSGQTITDSGNFTLDVAGDITLDADGADIRFKDSGSTFGLVSSNNADEFVIQAGTQDKDIIFKGNDGGSVITALTLDMSAGGKAVFANNIDFGDGHFIGNDGDDNLYIASSAGEKIRLDSPDDIILDADSGSINLLDGGTEVGRFLLDDNNHLKLKSIQSDADILFQGNDGGSGITALRFDMSDAGKATFNSHVKASRFGAGINPIVPVDILSTGATSTALRVLKSGSDDSTQNNLFSVTEISGHGRLSIHDTSQNEDIRLDSNGDSYFNGGSLGIGVTSLAAEMHINKTNAGGLGGRLLIQNNSSTSGTYCQLILAPTAATASTRCVVIQAENTDGNNNQDMVFKTSAGASPEDRMRLSSSGHLAINMGGNSTAIGQHKLIVNTDVTNGAVGNTAFVHIGPLNTVSNSNSDGYISGISLGYHENNNSYKHTAIAVRSHGDNAARRDMDFLVNSASEAGSATLADSKLNISSGNGLVSGDLNDTSDIGFKEDIKDLESVLDKVKLLKPRTFTWKGNKVAAGKSVGFVAQEVETVITDDTIVKGNDYNEDNLEFTGKSINTIGLVSYLTKAIQEQQTLIETQQTTINDLKSRIETLEG